MKIPALVLASIIACLVSNAHSQTTPSGDAPALAGADSSGDLWRIVYSPYTYHYSRDPAHKHVWMLGLERQRADNLVYGGTFFRNSFGQPSGYVYAGQRLEHFSAYDPLFAQWTAGVLYGYKGEYQDKVPLNHNGFSPGAVLSLGWQFTPMYSAQLDVLGNSALMFQVSADFR